MNRKILIFGDSHSIIFSQIDFVHEHWLGFNTNLPLTMYRFGMEGLDIKNAPTLLGNGHQNYVPMEGDIVIYSYGYLDIQKNILKQRDENKRTIEEMIKELIENYIQKIKENEAKFKIKSIVYGIFPPAWKEETHKKYYGSVTEKIQITKLFNDELRNSLQDSNIGFFDIYNLVTDSSGYIKREQSTKDGVHIDLDKAHIISNALSEFLSVCFSD